ncbi:MAG TPA: hypothetical protein VGM03_04000 [Phycisphaerae bacterium]|jgi:hypothetical protein
MGNVTITSEVGPQDAVLFRARANGCQALGRTAGEALDGLGPHLTAERTTVVLVQRLGGDQFFSPTQIERLRELMAQWRRARDAGTSLAPPDEQELETLIEREFDAAARRAEALAEQAGR